MHLTSFHLLSLFALIVTVSSWVLNTSPVRISIHKSSCLSEKKDSEDLEEVTKKYGLEAGLFKAVTSKDDNQKVKPQDLLAKYGAAYLITSISFAIVSYAICYTLVSNGVDVPSLLEKIGIKANAASSTAGTAGIAYAVHKAASPIRFPPTVALTPVVANLIGKKVEENEGK